MNTLLSRAASFFVKFNEHMLEEICELIESPCGSFMDAVSDKCAGQLKTVGSCASSGEDLDVSQPRMPRAIF